MKLKTTGLKVLKFVSSLVYSSLSVIFLGVGRDSEAKLSLSVNVSKQVYEADFSNLKMNIEPAFISSLMKQTWIFVTAPILNLLSYSDLQWHVHRRKNSKAF